MGILAGTAFIYFFYARPLAVASGKREVLTGEGFNLTVRGERLRVDNSPVFWKGPSKKKVVALTFDDGPHPVYTTRIIDILRAKDVRATFFVVGREIEKYPDVLKAEAAAGSEVDNHSYSHPQLSVETVLDLSNEINRTNEIIFGITGRRPAFFRPPKGLLNDNVFAAADAAGMDVVFWSASLERDASVDAKVNVTRLAAEIKPGSIILAHDGGGDREKTVEALPYLIDELRNKGYEFVTLEELFKIR